MKWAVLLLAGIFIFVGSFGAVASAYEALADCRWFEAAGWTFVCHLNSMAWMIWGRAVLA